MTDATECMRILTTRIKSLAGASTADLIGIAPGEAFSAEEVGELGVQCGCQALVRPARWADIAPSGQ
jgi:hypothetical protein